MHVCEYIAVNNPNQAQDLCDQHGLPYDSPEDAADSLFLISAQDKKSLREVMALHPEKEIILELFATNKQDFRNASGGTGCTQCKLNKMQRWSQSADGQPSAIKNYGDFLPQMQTNTLLVLGIISAFTIALIVATKKG